VCSRQITWAYDSVPPSDSGSGSGACAEGAGAANSCIVGNTGPGGGIVFYVNEANATGSRYMEAATSDLSGTYAWGVDPTTQGACGNLDIVTGTAIGDGKANTNLITTTAACNDSTKAPAVRAAMNCCGNVIFLESVPTIEGRTERAVRTEDCCWWVRC
jgi:hypothetical protein